MTTGSNGSSGEWMSSISAAARWSARMERAMERSKAAMATVIPSKTRGHMRAAWREQLLAVRSMIDFWADRLSDESPTGADGSDSAGNGGRHDIPID